MKCERHHVINSVTLDKNFNTIHTPNVNSLRVNVIERLKEKETYPLCIYKKCLKIEKNLKFSYKHSVWIFNQLIIRILKILSEFLNVFLQCILYKFLAVSKQQSLYAR